MNPYLSMDPALLWQLLPGEGVNVVFLSPFVWYMGVNVVGSGDCDSVALEYDWALSDKQQVAKEHERQFFWVDD